MPPFLLSNSAVKWLLHRCSREFIATDVERAIHVCIMYRQGDSAAHVVLQADHRNRVLKILQFFDKLCNADGIFLKIF